MNVTGCIGTTYMNKKVYVVRKPVKNVVTKCLVVEHHSRGDRMFSSSLLSYPYLEQECK
jgi:c-di-AMP phosphodiesterase-like protein